MASDLEEENKLLRQENKLLREQIVQLEEENEFLRTHPAFLQGLKGEKIIAKLTGGSLTSFAATHDIQVGASVSIEVKFSKLNAPKKGSSVRRWNWSKPLGWSGKKDYDFLVLVGEKDRRYPQQYVDSSPYVFFLIPRKDVPRIFTKGESSGSNVQLTTNLSGVRAHASVAIKKRMVPEELITSLIEPGNAAQ